MAPICTVCSENPQKYKCAKCQAPYCSIACYKTHNATVHSATAGAPSYPAIPAHQSTSIAASQPTPSAPPAAPPTAEELAKDPELQAIIKAHPTLKPLLQDLHTKAFLNDPSPPQHGDGRTPKHGRKAALYRLKQARSEGAASSQTDSKKRIEKHNSNSGRGRFQQRKGHNPRTVAPLNEEDKQRLEAEDRALREFRSWALAVFARHEASHVTARMQEAGGVT